MSQFKNQGVNLLYSTKTNDGYCTFLSFFSCTFITLCTIGMSLSLILKTTISPALIGSSWFVRNRISPLWKAGSMEPLMEKQKQQVTESRRTEQRTYLNTTTTGDSDFVTTIKPFQIIKAENTIIAKFSAWKLSCRLFFQSFLSSWVWDFTTSMVEILRSKAI